MKRHESTFSQIQLFSGILKMWCSGSLQNCMLEFCVFEYRHLEVFVTNLLSFLKCLLSIRCCNIVMYFKSVTFTESFEVFVFFILPSAFRIQEIQSFPSSVKLSGNSKRISHFSQSFLLNSILTILYLQDIIQILRQCLMIQN